MLALLLLALHGGLEPPVLGAANPVMFRVVLGLYVTSAIGFALASRLHQTSFSVQTWLQAGIDIVVVVLLMDASGGLSSGVGMLLVIVIAGSSLILAGRTALLLAALASLGVLAQVGHARIAHLAPVDDLPQAGFLGITLFATAMLFRVLAERANDNEALAKQRGLDLANLAELNEHIIEHSPVGLLVVDPDLQVRHINQAARNLLRVDLALPTSLQEVSPAVARILNDWCHEGHRTRAVLPEDSGLDDMQLRLHRLGSTNHEGTLISLDDVSALTERHQQIKLAALGRLTASIAHEIRNPLGAISHAAQLLSESADRSSEDQRLTKIIRQQSKRVNSIVESILRLSRRETPLGETIRLEPWVNEFLERFCLSEQLPPDQVTAHIEPPDLTIAMDERHLDQVLSNLCGNSVHHAGSDVRLTIRAGVGEPDNLPWLQISDDGHGIAADLADKIFEPFFTTSGQGTGLGLYIAGLLCELNHARLDCLPDTAQGACLRITFLHKECL